MSESYAWWARHGDVFFGTSEQLLPFSDAGYSTRSVRQVHGAQVLDDASFENCSDEADGLVTDALDTALIIRTADCVPILATDGCRIAAYHAGWRGTRAGVVTKIKDYVQPERSSILIGPAICTACYEVGPDLYSDWLADDPSLGAFLYPGQGPNKRQLDLVGFIIDQLRRLGFHDIRWQQGCTHGSPLPSYRRQGKAAGRLKHFVIRSNESPTVLNHEPIHWPVLTRAVAGPATQCPGIPFS